MSKQDTIISLLKEINENVDNLEQISIVKDIVANENNREYLPADYGVDAFSKVTVNVVPTKTKVRLININEECLDENAGWDGTSIDVSNVVSLADFCYKIRTATYINISGWDLTNNTSFRNMFFELGMDTNEGAILVLDNINTQNVTSLYLLLNNAKIKNSIDLSNWGVRNVKDYGYIMNGLSCPYVNIEGWEIIREPTSDGLLFFYRGNIPKINAAYTKCKNGRITAIAASNTETIVGDYTIDDVINNNIYVLEGLTDNSYINAYHVNNVLNRASLRALINGLADLTGSDTKTLTLRATLIAKLTEEDIAIATAKNWTIA